MPKLVKLEFKGFTTTATLGKSPATVGVSSNFAWMGDPLKYDRKAMFNEVIAHLGTSPVVLYPPNILSRGTTEIATDLNTWRK